MAVDSMEKHLRTIHSDLISVAAKLVRGEGVPDWSDHKFYQSTPRNERRDMLKALRDADDALRVYGIRLKEIADKVSAQIRVAETRARQCSRCNGLTLEFEPNFCPHCAAAFGGRFHLKAACEVCHGSGEIVFNKHGGDPAYDQSKPCPECTAGGEHG